MKNPLSFTKSITMITFQISRKTNIVHLKDSLKALISLRIWSIVMFMFLGGNLLGQVISWNSTGLSTTSVWATTPINASTVNSNLTMTTQLTRGTAIATSGSGIANAIGGSGGWSTSSQNNTSWIFAFKANSGDNVSLTSITGFTRRSSTGPSSCLIDYSINGSAFINAGSVSTTSTSGTGSQFTLSLTNISGLQNVPEGQIIKFRLNPSGTSGNWYLLNGADCLKLNGSVTPVSSYTWSGTTSTDWSTATNWNPNGVPDGSIDITIPSSASMTNSPSIGSLTINAGKTLTLQSGAKLTLSGTLSNNGTVNIENGATLVQTGSGTNSGSGTYNVKQTVSGSGGATPNGRFWYIGSPLSDGSSTALLSSTGNQLWQWDETNVNYVALTSGQTLSQGKSYVLRSGQTAETINFSGTGLINGTQNILNLSRTGTSTQMRGCHLVSNPYPSYLDWDMVGKTNVSTTIYVRTALGSNYNVLETYNSFDQIGTSISGAPMTKDIAPMQGFWVKVTTDGQTGSLAMDNSMRSHQANGAGLRSSAQDFPAFLRFNMFDGENKDQVILFMSPDASTSLDEHDSEKMIATGSAQFYSTVNAKKLVINGMKNVKAKTSVPLTLDLPLSKSYTFQAEEMNIEDGLILLEDKQEGVIQDLTINPVYSFFGNAGINSTRFVIHFHLPFPAFGTFDFEANELSANNTDLSFETSDITIFSNGKGQISVSLPSTEMKDAHLEVIDASGRTKLKKKLIEKETVTNLDICSGIYYIRVSSSQNIKLQKIFIQPE
jgi:hypothetical protein